MEIRSGAVDAFDNVSEAFELARSQFGGVFAMSIIVIGISFGVQFAMSIVNNVVVLAMSAIVGAGSDGHGGGYEAFLIQGMSFLSGTVLGIVSTVVTSCLFCGFYIGLARFRNERTIQVGDVFKGVSLWKPCLAYAFVSTAAQVVLAMIFIGGGLGVVASTIGLDALVNFDPGRGGDILAPAIGGFVILGLIAFVVVLIWSITQLMVLPLIARGEDFTSAFVGSIKAGFSNFGGLLLFVIVSGLLGILGVLACFIGLLFVLPILFTATFVVSEKIFGPVAREQHEGPPAPDQFGFSGGYSGFQGQ